MSQLTHANGKFYLDGEPFTVISGTIHYYRIVPEYWESSLKKLRACGFNTVETYTCWNLHERKPGQFDFSGNLDIERFFTLAQEVGLKVLLRPGPYTCAEWEWGGFPAWLMEVPGMQIRCNNEPYLHYLNRYVQELYRHIGRFYADKGGPIILTQVENEYGSYGNDHDYMRAMKKMLEDAGATGMFMTADGSLDTMLTGGMTEDALPAVNFGPHNVLENFHQVEKRERGYPMLCGEFWGGNFDRWGEPRHGEPTDVCANSLAEMLDYGASVNYYMFQGGTNFSLYAGANYFDHYAADVTSYDYTSPLSEAGDRTDKYYAVKKVIEDRFGPSPEFDDITDTTKIAYGKVALTQQTSLLSQLDKFPAPVKNAVPLNMEKLGQDFGFVLYTTKIDGPLQEGKLDLGVVHDRAQVFLNGKYMGVVERDGHVDEISFSVPAGEVYTLQVLVENRGRVNYGPRMGGERKGLLDVVRFSHMILFGWESQPLPVEFLPAIEWEKAEAQFPLLMKGTFTADELGDTFLKLPGFIRGIVWINGHCLGRYWRVGPQQTLYVPAPWLKEGENELIVLELDGLEKPEVEFLSEPELDDLHTEWL